MSLVSDSAAVSRQTVRSGRRSRLALAEALLRTTEPGECAQEAVDWLASGGARWAVCMLRDGDSPRFRGVAGHGLAAEAARNLLLNLEAPGAGDLAEATRRRETVLIGARRIRVAGLSRRSLFAAPVVGNESRGGECVGLLLVSPPEPALRRTLTWVADLVGARMGRLLIYETLAEAEHRLQRERALLTAITNAVTDPILLTDTEGRMIVANTRAEMLFVASEAESEGRRRAVALNNMLFSAALSRSALADAGTLQAELALVDPSEGSDLLFELLTTTISDAREGNRLVSVLRNVTDLRSATQEIEENYRRLRSAEADVRAERDRLNLIIDSVADPIVVTDPSGNIALMNAPAERLFTAFEERKGDAAQRAVQANDARFSSFVANVMLAGPEAKRRGELSLVDPTTGAAIPFEGVSGKVHSEHGEVTAVVTILHDRTEALENARLYEQVKRSSVELEEKVNHATAELMRQNELLRRQHLALEQASALKSQFLANMSHEFRTPLNAIIGYTSMLLQGIGGTLSPQQRRSLERVDSNSQHLLSIIQDLLDISRIEAGKMPLNVSEFEVDALIAEVMAEAEPLVTRSRLEVRQRVPDDLPKVRSDRHKVKQILVNLLSNALKFTPSGHVEIRAGHETTSGRIWIAVEDTGIGIAADDQPKVFEDFRQVDPTPARQYQGAGLGLSICRRLATMLQGTLALRSAPDQGSTFTLELPLRLRKT